MLRRSALAMLAVAAAGPAFGQAYPSKPINLIVPFSAGGPTDVMARIVGEHMSKELGQQFIIDNRGGAGGTLGASIAAKAETVRVASRWLKGARRRSAMGRA